MAVKWISAFFLSLYIHSRGKSRLEGEQVEYGGRSNHKYVTASVKKRVGYGIGSETKKQGKGMISEANKAG
jgi:hypothetical protein